MPSERECTYITDRLLSMEREVLKLTEKSSSTEQRSLNHENTINELWCAVEKKSDKEDLSEVKKDLASLAKLIKVLVIILSIITALMFQEQLPQILSLVKLVL